MMPTAPGVDHPVEVRGPQTLRFRSAVRPDDAAQVREIVEATGFFSAAEVAVAVELVEERLAAGPASGYEFLFAEEADRTLGYACFGPIPMTASSWDLYWIAVRREAHRRGLGRALLAEVEQRIGSAGGERVYVDTSSRPGYAPTRAFYRACGYGEAAALEDFFAPGDGKVIYCKVLAWNPPSNP